MGINRILRNIENEFEKANKNKDYRGAHQLFEQLLPLTDSPTLDERITDFLHKLRDKKIITQTQFIHYRARQVQYAIDSIRREERYDKKSDDSDKNSRTF